MNFLMSGKSAATHAVARLGRRGFDPVHVTTGMQDEVLVVPGIHDPRPRCRSPRSCGARTRTLFSSDWLPGGALPIDRDDHRVRVERAARQGACTTEQQPRPVRRPGRTRFVGLFRSGDLQPTGVLARPDEIDVTAALEGVDRHPTVRARPGIGMLGTTGGAGCGASPRVPTAATRRPPTQLRPRPSRRGRPRGGGVPAGGRRRRTTPRRTPARPGGRRRRRAAEWSSVLGGCSCPILASVVRSQGFLELVQSDRALTLDAALADSQVGRGLGHRQPPVVTQHDDPSLPGWQRLQRPDQRRVVVRSSSRDGLVPLQRLGLPPPRAPHLVDVGVDDDPARVAVQPVPARPAGATRRTA